MEIKEIKKIEIPAQEATPAPPLGPQVGQLGINIMQLCKEFNSATANIEKGAPVPIILTVYKNKSFSIELKSLPTAYLLKIRSKNKYIHLEDVREVLEVKYDDLTGSTEQAKINTILGTAKSMGLQLKETA